MRSCHLCYRAEASGCYDWKVVETFQKSWLVAGFRSLEACYAKNNETPVSLIPGPEEHGLLFLSHSSVRKCYYRPKGKG